MIYYLDILANIGITVILALSLNLIIGMTGLLQLGHAGFFAVGAYTAALTSIYLHGVLYPLGPWASLITCGAAMLLAAISALAIGIPCLRLRGDYLAIATLAFGEVVQKLLISLDFPGNSATIGGPGARFGGASGVSIPGHPTDLSLGTDGLLQPINTGLLRLLEHLHLVPAGDWVRGGHIHVDAILADPRLRPLGRFLVEILIHSPAWWFIWLCVAATFLILLNLKHSRYGRAMLAIREDEIAARAMGIHAPYLKVLSFLICAAFAGLAGALFAHKAPIIGPADFGLLKTIEILLIVVLGGLGSYTGAVLASLLIVLLPAALASLPELTVTHTGLALDTDHWIIHLPLGLQHLRPHLPIWDIGHVLYLGAQRELLFALLFILLVRFVPHGFFGTREPRLLPRLCTRPHTAPA